MSDYIAEIQATFLKLHGCEAVYLETVPVVEEFQGQTIWQGDVEVFKLEGHPKATRGYGLESRHRRTRSGETLLYDPGIASSRFTTNSSQSSNHVGDSECEK